MKKKTEKLDKTDSSPIPNLSRIYPEKICANTIYCVSGGTFQPHDKRQTFCTSKCGENFRNDQRHLKNNREFANEKLLRKLDKKLEKLFNHFLSGNCAEVWQEFFRYEGVDFRFMVYENTNDTTQRRVRWFYRFGVERHPTKADFYLIHMRKI